RALIPADFSFSPETAELIGGNISTLALSPVERVRLSVLLTMITSDEIAALIETSPEEAVAMFELGAVNALAAAAP
ncbi:MAG: hypothetical protein ACREH3_19580, partial [Geminicoccales bacterium]